MKPSQTNRCARTMARDFLVGLALFLTVFTLAMLDSRASHSAPAFIAKPVTITQNRAFTPIKISMRTMDPGGSHNRAADFKASNSTLSLPGDWALAGAGYPALLPLVKKKTALPGSGSAVEATGKNSKLAMTISKRKAGNLVSSRITGPGDRTWMLGVMALIFATMTALTLGLWRHLRVTVSPRRGGRRV